MPDPSYKDPLLDLLTVDNGDELNEENNYDILDLLTGNEEIDPDPDKKVSKSTYTETIKTNTGSSGNYTSHNYFGKDRSVSYQSDLDEKKYTKTLDDGNTVDISLMELSDPKKNPELNQYILDKNEEFDKEDLFKPYKIEGRYSQKEGYTIGGKTVEPYKKELDRNRAFLNELAEKDKLDTLKEEYRWNNDLSDDDGTLEVPQEILENYTRNETLKSSILTKGIEEQWTDVLEDMSDGVRKANLLELGKRYDDADANNYIDDQDKFMLKAQTFNSDKKVRKVLSFEENVLDEDYVFENVNNEELVYLNGKPVPVSLYKD